MIVADSAEPKSIDELRSYGVNIIPVVKGKDSVAQGIQFVQDQRISVTKNSYNVIKEYRNYLFEVDKDGKVTNDPSPVFNHSMDAVRYGFDALRKVDTSELDIPDDQKMFKQGFY
jgi:phage terminase large subunit